MSEPASPATRRMMAEAMVDAMMLRPIAHHIMRAETEEEIVEIVNDAIDRDWLREFQMPLLDELILA